MLQERSGKILKHRFTSRIDRSNGSTVDFFKTIYLLDAKIRYQIIIFTHDFDEKLCI